MSENKVIRLTGRIDANNVAEWDRKIEEERADAMSVIFDASELTYISSAGLRILMKTAKRVKSATVQDVSAEVYDIFNVTGFTEILDVRKAVEEIDLTGCEVVGEGGNGTVYRIDDDKIVKMYKPWISREKVEQERSFAQRAFISGVPSVIAYGVVKSGDCYGLIFEMLKSDTLGHKFVAEPENEDVYVAKYVELAKSLHATHPEPGVFEDIKSICHQRIDNLTALCSEEEISLLHSLIDEIPDCDTLIHNDLHPGNIMIQDGELLLIDMPDMTVGPVEMDLVGIYRDMISAPQNAPERIEHSVGMPAEQILRVGNKFFSAYTGITSQDELQGYYQKLGLVYALNVVIVIGAMSEYAMDKAPVILDQLLRGVIVSNEQALRQILRSMK